MKKTWIDLPGTSNSICMASMCKFWKGPGRCSEGFVTIDYKGLILSHAEISNTGKCTFYGSDKKFCTNKKCNKWKDNNCTINKIRLKCYNTKCAFWTDNQSCSVMTVYLDEKCRCKGIV